MVAPRDDSARDPVQATGANDLSDPGSSMGRFGRIYARAIEDSPVGFCVISWGDFRFLQVNEAFAQMLGYRPEEILGRANTEFLHPDQLAWDAEIKQTIGAGAPVPKTVVRMLRHRDGSTVWAEVHPVMLTEADGTRILVSQYLDITARKAAEDERDRLAAHVAESRDRLEHLYSEAVDNSHIGHSVLSRSTFRYVRVNTAFADMLGYEVSEVVGRANLDFVPPEQVSEDRETQRQFLAGRPMPTVARRRYLRKDGAVAWLDVYPVQVADEDGDTVIISQYIDVTEVVEAQRARAAAEAETERTLAELRHRSTHDLLTGLPNRQALIEAIDHLLRRGDGNFAVLYLDLDNFKNVNDAFSHAAGDKVLATFAGLLRNSLRAEDSCGRIGGDEFVVIADGITSTDDAVAVAERLQHGLASALLPAGSTVIAPRFSVGIALGRPGARPNTLLEEADAALRRSKSRGKSRWEVYDDKTRLEAARRLEVGSALQDALTNAHIHAHYQPIVDMRTRRLVGYEALARWQRDDDWVPAADWIGIAEETGLIVEIGRTIVAESIRRLAGLPPPITVSLNASGSELSYPGFTDWIGRRLAVEGADPRRLIIEVTEQSLLDAAGESRRSLDTLVSKGAQVHLDDFGTGYSSITHLRELPVTGIKLDRSFTRSMQDPALVPDELVPALAKLADHLGLDTVAEGVETEGQAAALLHAGWLIGQGYLFGRPQPPPAAVDPRRESVDERAADDGAPPVRRRTDRA